MGPSYLMKFSLVIKMLVEYSIENRNILCSSNSKNNRSQPETRIPPTVSPQSLQAVGPNVPQSTCLLLSSGSCTNFVADLNPDPNGQLCSDVASCYPSSHTIVRSVEPQSLQTAGSNVQQSTGSPLSSGSYTDVCLPILFQMTNFALVLPVAIPLPTRSQDHNCYRLLVQM